MNEGAYFALSAGYDRLNSETDYAAWAEFVRDCFTEFGDIEIKEVLDLACGTGAMTFPLRELGYDMTAVDISCEMLSVAMETANKKGIEDILWLCQDMREFELYGTVQGAVCTLDGINHLTGAADLPKCLSLLHNYIEPGGIFIFDVNTPAKFKYFYGENDYILEDENFMCCWQNDYNEKRRICTFYLTVFEKTEDGLWKRTDTEQRERCYSRNQLEGALGRAGFEVCAVYGSTDKKEAEPTDHRWYFVCKRI